MNPVRNLAMESNPVRNKISNGVHPLPKRQGISGCNGINHKKDGYKRFSSVIRFR